MEVLLLFILVVSMVTAEDLINLPQREPDVDRNVTEMATSKGYHVEEHMVTTSDCYNLCVIRIGPPTGINQDKPVVLVLHPMITDSSVWFLNTPNQSLGYLLPDAGYDVWMINFRGSKYSRTHTNLTTEDNKYWNFSFDEMGTEDVPATMEYIRNKTGKKKISVACHSMGCTALLICLSERPEYNDLVNVAMVMAPGTTFYYSPSLLKPGAPLFFITKALIKIFAHGELNTNTSRVHAVIAPLCALKSRALRELCNVGLFTAFSMSGNNINESRLGVMASHVPSPTSVMVLDHFAQTMTRCLGLKSDCVMRMYDYGPLGNLYKYGNRKAPEVSLENVKIPIFLWYGRKDDLSSPKDNTDILKNKLINSNCKMYEVADSEFNHLDFDINMKATDLVYKPMIQRLNEANYM